MLTIASQLAIGRLRAYRPPPLPSNSSTNPWSTLPVSRRAAVLILLFPDKAGELRVVLTMRAASLSSYSGHAALPGGKADFDGESAFQCARREASEEIGLPRSDAKLPRGFKIEELCEMPVNLAKTELVVRPCVAFLHNTASARDGKGGEVEVDGGDVESQLLPRLDAREVAAVFSAPFMNFLYARDLEEVDATATERFEGDRRKDGAFFEGVENVERETAVRKEGESKWYSGAWTDWHEQRWRMHNFFVPVSNQTVTKPKHDGRQNGVADQLEGLDRYRVWGMTARILVDAARCAYDQEPEFEHNSHFGDEGMIGRLRKIGKLGAIRKKGDELTDDDLKKAANL
ncbi:hypothetical protein R6Q59_010019 [Mikania micrantha]